MFKNEYEYLTHLIRCTIHNLQPQEAPPKLKFEDIFEAAKSHDIANIAFVAVEKLKGKPNEELYKKWKSQYAFSIQRNANQESAKQSIETALSQNGIRNVQIQGTVVKKLYPYDFWRNMSDLDFVIDKHNLHDAEKIMHSIGYKTKHLKNYELALYGPGRIAVEFHCDFCNPTSEFFGVVNNPFEKAVKQSESCVYIPNQTDVFLHNVLHTIKHHRIYGAGIRRILDIYFLNQRLLPKTDKNYIYSVLQTAGSKQDYDILSQIALEWFDFNGQKTDYNEVKKQIFMSDNHGSLIVTVMNQNKKSQNKAGFRFKKFITLAFPPKEQMYNAHSFCARHKLPIVLCWIYRFFHILKNRKKRKNAFEILNILKK